MTRLKNRKIQQKKFFFVFTIIFGCTYSLQYALSKEIICNFLFYKFQLGHSADTTSVNLNQLKDANTVIKQQQRIVGWSSIEPKISI